jgi:predicted aspartyl protease
VLVIFMVGGCQLADVARFTYANATATHQWAGESQTTTLPFELVDDHIILPVRVNGSEPLNFVLDSGAAATVILESRLTNSLDLKMGGELPISGVGTGPDPVAHIVKVSDLSVGKIHIKGLSLVYLPLESVPFFENLDEVYFDGVIGAQFFERFVVAIDYDRQLISFSEPDSKFAIAATDDAKWDELPLQITGGLPYLTTTVDSFSGDEVSVTLLVDTGYRGPVSLTPDTHDSIEPPQQFFSMVGQGLSGDVEINVGMTESFHIGKIELDSLPVSYSIQGGESDDDSNGLLGNEVLRRFNVVFDYPNERMLVSPNDSFAEPIHADRSGLLIRPHLLGAVVKSIAPGSAAANTELQVGDIITSINDDAMTRLSIMKLKTQLASDQDTVSICWNSGIESQCGQLLLASRYNSYSSRN